MSEKERKRKEKKNEKFKFEVSLCLVFSCAVYISLLVFCFIVVVVVIRSLPFILMEMSAITRQRRMINGEGMLWEEVCHEYWTHWKNILHHYINILNQLKVLFFFVLFIVRYFLPSYLSLSNFLSIRAFQVDTLTAYSIFIFIVINNVVSLIRRKILYRLKMVEKFFFSYRIFSFIRAIRICEDFDRNRWAM